MGTEYIKGERSGVNLWADVSDALIKDAEGGNVRAEVTIKDTYTIKGFDNPDETFESALNEVIDMAIKEADRLSGFGHTEIRISMTDDTDRGYAEYHSDRDENYRR